MPGWSARWRSAPPSCSESLEQQTAISEVLRVISLSSTDLTPVFEAILQSARRLLGTVTGAVFRYDGKQVHLVATHGWPQAAHEDAKRLYPAPPNPAMISGRTILRGSVQVINDIRADPAYDPETAQLGVWRRMLAAPMAKDGSILGVIAVSWPDPGEIGPRQIELLKTFADQAVIAIENARLIIETREALERQTATSEILRVISESPTDVQPVLDAVAERATVLCESLTATVWLFDGQVLRPRANFARDPALRLLPSDTIQPRRTLVNGRAFVDRLAIHVEDVVPLLDTEYPDAREPQRRNGFRAMLAVPLLRDEQAIGTIFTWRREPRAFSPEQVALLKTFADQAVIAIENVRLFNETKEALEQQTATAEVLKVISGSLSDVQPVLEAVALRSRLLGRADNSRVWLLDGDHLRSMTGFVLDDGSESGRDELHAAEGHVRDRPRLSSSAAPCMWTTWPRCSTANSPTRAASSRATASAPCSACRCCATACRSAPSASIARQCSRSRPRRSGWSRPSPTRR